jgi:beta-glucanase (GH16 family)
MKKNPLFLSLSVLVFLGCFGVEKPEKPGWELTFHDEFDQIRLDKQAWVPMDPWQKERNNELQAYVRDAFELEDGILKIVASERQAGYDGKVREYASGMMTTCENFSQKYGWFEVRCKVPKGKGLWPAFWLLPEPLGWPPEIDVLEVLGHEPTTIYFNNHWFDDEGKHLSSLQEWHGTDLSADYHVIALEWNPDVLIWYVDGQERARTTDAIPQQPMFLLLNLAVGGAWPGAPDSTTVFPSSFDVDYVRVYERKSS